MIRLNKRNLILAGIIMMTGAFAGCKGGQPTASTGIKESETEEVEPEEIQNPADVIAGNWELNRIFAAHLGEEAEYKNKEENASLYGGDSTVYFFMKDGTGTRTVTDENGEMNEDLVWEFRDGEFIVTVGIDGEEPFTYDRENDTLSNLRRYVSGNAEYETIEYVYIRNNSESEPGEFIYGA